MKKISIFASLLALFSCKDPSKEKTPENKFSLNSQQDTINKKVTQTIFGEVAEFSYEDFANLKTNKAYDRFFAGQLKLTSGQVICVDPLVSNYALPQSWTVEPGEYPVYLYIALEGDFQQRVAYAELNIKDEIPVYWEYSLIPESMLKDSVSKKINGMYPVDAGLSCFTDLKTWELYQKDQDDFYMKNKNGNYYDDLLAAYFKENANIPTSSRGEDWINYKPLNSEVNIIMFGTGWGDGMYPRYVGYDRNGNVVKMITDFIQINETKKSE